MELAETKVRDTPPPELWVTRPGVEITTPAEVIDATRADVSIETEVAFRAAHSSPFANVPV